jgi:peptidoglycan glycosyltransferase
VTRRREAALILFAALIAAAGTALVALTAGEGLPIDVAAAGGAHLAAFGGLHVAARLWAAAGSRLLIPPVALVTALGSIEVFRIDPDLGRLQRWWLLLAAALAAGLLHLMRDRGVDALRRFRYLSLAAALLLLAAPLLPAAWPLGGATVNGARLWLRLDLGDRSLSFQPGEAAKILLVVFLASYLTDRWRGLSVMPRSFGPLRLPEPRQLLPVVLAFGVAFIVLVYQRDIGASLLLFVVFVLMLAVATGRAGYLVAGGALAAGGAVAAANVITHVAARVTAWLRPFDDFTGAGFQVAQGVFALADAGLVGTGLGNGSPYLIPAAATDYVFVAITEEIGLAGGLAMLAAYALVVATGFGIALRAADRFRSLLAGGLTITLAVQTLLIVGGVLRLLPLTGIALPFASYGGSSLLANMAIVALLCRISHEERA